MGEEFEIRVGEEIRDDLPFKKPHLPRGGHRVWGDPTKDDVRVIFAQRAYEEVNEHARSGPGQEVGGALLGKAYRYEGTTYIEVRNIIPAQLTEAGTAHVTFTPDTWSAINRQRDERFPDLNIVGWYHTHPNMEIFLSQDDKFLHQSFFPEPWQVALVVDPYKHHGNFFIWEDGTIRSTGGFYELFDVNKQSIINWRNLLKPIPVPVPKRGRMMPAALIVLAVLMLGCGILNLLTLGSLIQLRRDLASARATAEDLRVQVDLIGARIETVTAVAQEAAMTSTAVVHATEEARVVEEATAAAQATRAALIQAARTAEAMQAMATTVALEEATSTAEALSPTLQPELTATPEIAPTVSPTRVVTQTPVVTPTLILGQGLLAEQERQKLIDGAEVSVGSPMEFAFTLRNSGPVSITIEYLVISLEHDKKPEPIMLEQVGPFELSSGGESDFSFMHSFVETGEYTAYILVQMGDTDVPVEVQALEGQQSRITFVVVPSS